MRDLIVSDIHANWEALQAVLARAAGSYDRIVCCGDLIGYGPDPNRVLDWARSQVAFVVRGNHDKAAAGLENLDWFNPVARTAALWTLRELTGENLEYAKALPRGPLPVDGYQIAHGSPLDEDEYVVCETDADHAFAYLDRDITFFGHTHIQGGFALKRRRVHELEAPHTGMRETTVDLDPDTAYLINPGSVGQPRDRDPRAAWALYDSESRSVSFCREPYDIETVQAKMRRAGLPAVLADRLAVGQ